jgi:DHA2 family multidrug resistance protein
MMPIAGFLIGRRIDMRWLMTGGLIVAAIGTYMFSYLNLNAGPWDFFWPQMVMGAGLSFMFVPLATITVDPIPQEEMGYATSLIALARNLGAGVGISVFTAFVVRRQQLHQMRLDASLASRPNLLSHALSGLQGHLFQQGQSAPSSVHQALGIVYQDLLARALALSYLDGFRVMAVLMLIAAPFVWIMKNPRFKSPAGSAAE